MIDKLKKHILGGGAITRKQAAELYIAADLGEFCAAADEIRRHFCGGGFDLCNIINAKSGGCSEDCKFCAQSAKHKTSIEEYGLIGADKAVEQAIHNYRRGVNKFSLVTSGRSVGAGELGRVCAIYRAVREAADKLKADEGLAKSLELCASLGLLSYEQLAELKAAGVTRYHCNLETSRNYFPKICTTHTYDDKLDTIRAAVRVGMDVCSGGIMGMGESADDRLDMAFELRELGIGSVPINYLSPIAGTPLYGRGTLAEDEAKRIAAVYRFILPNALLRLSGGRGLYKDGGHCLVDAGFNAAITGDMLTTPGVSVENDLTIKYKI